MSPIVDNAITGVCFLTTAVKTTFLIIFVPWRVNYAPLQALLNNHDHKDDLTKRWRSANIGELKLVGLACALVAGVTTQALSWLPEDNKFWLTASLWYGATIMSLTAISSATQQSLFLYRLDGYSDGLERLRHILGRPNQGDPKTWSVRLIQLFIWQVPVMLLNFSILLFVTGLMRLLYQKASEQFWMISATDTKSFLVVSVFAGLSLASYVTSTSCLYYRTHAQF